AGVRIEKHQGLIERPTTSLGLQPVRVALHPEVSVTIAANVAQSAEEAEMQAKGIDPLRAREEEEEVAQAAPQEETPSLRDSPPGRPPGRQPSPRLRGEGEVRTAGS